MSLLPVASFDEIPLSEANSLLVRFGHKMGPVRRGNSNGLCHALFHEGQPVGVVTAHCLITPHVGPPGAALSRENTLELSRLCAARPGLCRVVLRLWREFVFPFVGKSFAVSYQDARLHDGNLYRFDGWQRIWYSRSGTDSRSGRKGRDKFLWLWPPVLGLDLVRDFSPKIPSEKPLKSGV